MSKWMSVTARLFVAGLLVSFFVGTVMGAKEPNRPGPGHKMREPNRPMRDPVEMRLEAMTKNLDLTKEQQGKVKPILQDQMKQMQALRTDQTLKPEARQVKLQEIQKGTDQKIETLLTPAQKEKFKKQEEMRNQRREQMKERMEKRRAEGHQPGAKPAAEGNSVKK